jgi:glycosyltransferase involved in cell wall biosynthesis
MMDAVKQSDRRAARILLCSKSGTFGGVEMRMGLEARFLMKEGYFPAVGINKHPLLAEWIDVLERDHIPVYDFDPPPFMERWRWRTLNKLRAKRFAARFFRRYRPDLVHVFLPWTTFGGTRIWVAHFSGIPSVLSVRNAFWGGSEIWSPWHIRHYEEAFRSVRGVYAISSSALDNFLNIFGKFIQPDTLMEVIVNGVDTVRFQPNAVHRVKARETLGIPQDSLVMGTVGRLDKQKRPEAILSVFVELKRTFPNLYLVLVGTGSLEQSVRRQVEALGLARSVIFVGFTDRVENLLPAFDLFVILSSVEGFGTATAEAMACGLPVVGTDVAGTRDILSNTKAGILVPVEDQETTVKACARVLGDNNLRVTMAKAAREEAEQKYDLRRWENRISAFYENVFKRS